MQARRTLVMTLSCYGTLENVIVIIINSVHNVH